MHSFPLAVHAALRFSSGWAAPSFFALCLGCLYLWFLVLRVPKLGEELAEAGLIIFIYHWTMVGHRA